MTDTGGRLGGALSSLLAETLTKHQAASAGLQGELKSQFTAGFMESLENELAPMAESVLGWLRDEDTAPPFLRAIAEQSTAPQHQTDLLIQVLSLVAVVTGGFTVMAQPMMQTYLNDAWRKHTDKPLEPPALAEMFTRGLADWGYVRAEAALSGTNEDRMRHLVDINGEAPAPMDLLLAHRRGVIDGETMRRGIVEGHLRNEWIDMLQGLQFEPMSTSLAIEAAVQGHLSRDQAREIARQNGLKPEHFQPWFDTAGSPPGVDKVLELLNREIITEADARQAIEESPFKPIYTPWLMESRVNLPPREAIVLMIVRHVIDQPTAVKKFRHLGYSQEDATFLAQEAANRKLQPERDLTKAEITALYAGGFINRGDAHGFLHQLGYDDHEADMVINLVDATAERQARQAAQNRIHSLYVGYRLDRTEASLGLDQIGLVAGVRDTLLAMWTHEREANAKDFTKAELTNFFTSDMIDRPTYLARLQRLGYTEADAIMYAEYVRPSE